MNRWLSISAVILLAFCIGVAPTSASEFSDTVRAGMKLTAEEAEALEARLDRNPEDLQARSRLVVYYFTKSPVDPAARRTHSQHVLWLIRNAPQADVLGSAHSQIQPIFDADSYNAGKDAWLSHIEREPTNVTFVGNAASFFWEFQDRQLVIETLQKTQSLDPDNSRWPTLLGHLYLRHARSSKQLRNSLRMSGRFDADDPNLPSSLADLFDQRPPEEPSSAVLVSCHASSVASARPTGSVARRVPAGNGGPIAKGRNAATGPV